VPAKEESREQRDARRVAAKDALRLAEVEKDERERVLLGFSEAEWEAFRGLNPTAMPTATAKLWVCHKDMGKCFRCLGGGTVRDNKNGGSTPCRCCAGEGTHAERTTKRRVSKVKTTTVEATADGSEADGSDQPETADVAV